MKRIFFNLLVIAMMLPSAAVITSCDKEELPPEQEQTDDEDKDDDGKDEGDEPSGVERSVKLDATEKTLKVGETFVLTATFEGEGTADLDFTWTSSNTDFATVAETADDPAKATVTAVAEGTAVITIACKDEEAGIDLSASATVTVTAAEPETPEADGVIRILAIGNSFSQDAVDQYLWDLFNAAGQKAFIGNMYIGGCSLDKHWDNAQNDAAAYEYHKIADGTKEVIKEQKLSEVIASEPWDYISLQQVSGESGQYDTYTHLPDMINYVKGLATNPDMKIVYHQTWAYQNGADHADFPDYDSDQMTMYNAIMTAVKQAAEANSDIAFVIPSGTAVQNGRTSFIGDNFCRDGYHLEVNYGRFTASCTWFESIAADSDEFTGNSDVTANTWKPESVSDYYAEIAKAAAHAAVANPYEVTEMTDYQTPDITSDGTTPMYVDFGSKNPSTELPWTNNVGSAEVSEGAVWLTDCNGAYTGATLSITAPFNSLWDGVGTEKNVKDETFEAKGVVFPYNVWTDALVIGGKKSDLGGDGDKGPATIEISGLEPSKTYKFTILTCRWEGSTGPRKIKLQLRGSSSTEAVTVDTGMPKNTAWASYDLDSYASEFTGVTPDAEGRIYLDATAVDAGHATVVEGHLNGMVITPEN